MNGVDGVRSIFAVSRANLTEIILILVGAWLLIALEQRLLSWLAVRSRDRYRHYFLATVPLLRLCIMVVAFILLIPRIIEPTFENMVALMGMLGLALGFAFRDYVSSLIAGVVTLYECPYRPGDWIEVDGTYGEVKSIGMRAAKIVTPDDTVVVIPHLKFWDQLILNANNGGPNLQCVAHFYLHPYHDAALVRHTLYDVALTSAFLQIDQPIKVVVQDEPWGTHYRLRAYPIHPGQQFQFITDLTVRGKAALTSLGVNFAQVPAMPH
ncbi:MAG: mechanosensitive ion channel family protein [Gammaproteobacteria bacterium]